ncbi:MAG: hypothetical protein mread185_000102 [Mycoplasmataceae bacterium]|nr:MAG: hypothetical protein mread185_000102 [Mycoplasmataceae bacterium]
MVNPKITENEFIYENIEGDLYLSDLEPDQDVSENFKKFHGKTLIFRNCSKLKQVDVDCLGLVGIKFEGDCSQLEHLSAYGNDLTELDLTNQKQLNYLNVDDNKLQSLQIKGCESLDKLSCRNNQLSELVLDLNNDEENSPNLKKNTSLTYLNCANNQIRELEVKHLTGLKKLSCNNNYLNRLDASGLKFLQFLNCANNIRSGWNYVKKEGLNYLNVDVCDSLIELDAGENSLKRIELDEHPHLWNVSFKSNELEILVITNCPNLHYLTTSFQEVSKYNIEKFFKQIGIDTVEKLLGFFNILNRRRNLMTKGIDTIEKALEFLRIDSPRKILKLHMGKGRRGKPNYDDILKLEASLGVDGVKWKFIFDRFVQTYFFIDEITRNSLKGMLYDERISFYDIKEKQTDSGYASDNEDDETNFQPITIADFPNLDKEESGIDHLADNPLFELWRDRKIEEEENAELGYDSSYEREEAKKKKNSEPIITDPNQLKNKYPDLLKGKFGQGPEITITGGRLAGTLIIDGYQGYKINVGNNRGLEYLWIKNCPNLTTLRYAHCGLKNGDAFIDWDSCRNLKTIDKYNCDGRIEWGNPEDEENEKGYQEEFNEDLEEDKQSSERKEKINDQVKLLLNRIKNQKNIPFQDFLDIFSGSSMQFVFNSLDQATNDEFGVIFTTRLNNHVEELIANHKQMNKGKLADELEKIMPFWELLSPHLQAQLTRLAKGEQLEVVANQNIWPWIIGLGVIFLLTSTIGYFLIKKLVKWDLNRQINKKAKN